ncbi:MAG: 16S rRNA (cytosine(1402)-N(4))-methyltransferase RsmH [Phycisphaerales bacterium]|nr:16S rRNA (cytosine(1402)-N(4))-methyltransferase RsmH [Phycisphaerales bacterium]
MSASDSGHLPVLLEEVLESLAPRRGDVFIDATAGRGGHASAIAAAINPGRILLLDRDADNLRFALARVREIAPESQVDGVHCDFRTVAEIARKQGVSADIVLADLGISSNQLDDAHRGFAFQQDGPLDMRLDQSSAYSAADLIRDLRESDIADLIYNFGEDPFARLIARKVAQTRTHEPILTTAHLARLVREAYGSRARASRLHPATRTFMALRIAVNDELRALEDFLRSIAQAVRSTGDGWISSRARVAVISFHSLEDRQVKRTFAALADEGVVERVNRKPVVAGDSEVARNPRSRSAKLRTVVRLARKS